MSLDEKYQEGFKHPDLLSEEGCPPCPNCNGKMIPWDYWLVTGATCKDCGWNMSEGGGSLI